MYKQTIIAGESFNLHVRYSPGKALGNGSCGVVISCEDEELGIQVAIKKIGNFTSDVMMATRALREIRLLKLLSSKHLVRFIDVMKPPQTAPFSDVYIIQELMETNLSHVIRSPQPLTMDHVRCFMWQLLSGLHYLHAANVIHRDIKPANILVNANCALKICDFGLATCSKTLGDDKQSHPLTEYVVTRWYRSPEVVLSCSHYDNKIDIWSAGCVMAELLQRQVFFPGTDSVSQIKIICAKLGTPIEEDILFVNSSAAQRFLRSLKGERKCLRYHFPLYNDDIHAMELLEATLKFNPHNRITATRALQSNFFNIYREEILEEPDFDFSSYCTDESLDQNILQDLVWAELRELHNDLPLAQGRMTMQTDTDIELDDYSDTDSHPPCHIVGFKSHNDFASKVIMTSQKRMRSAATGIGFKVKKRTGNGSYSYSPGSLINFLKQSTKDIDDANSIAEEAVEVDNYRSSFSSTLSGGASDDENSFCYVDGDKYGDTSFILPPLPIVAHHLVDITNPFSSFAKRNQSIKNNFGL